MTNDYFRQTKATNTLIAAEPIRRRMKNEWLENIGVREVERVINDQLQWSGVDYELTF